MTETPKKGQTFTCAHCGYVGESDWSEEEANAECKELFGELPPPEDRVVVCDDCFREALAILPPEIWVRRGRA